MKLFCASLLVTFTSAFAADATLLAQSLSSPPPPATMSAPTLVRIDGQLRTPTGEARAGTVTIVVSLYANQDDTTPLWIEQQAVTLDAAGRYTLFAGATLPDGIPQEVLTGSNPARWLGVAVQGEAELFRMMLVTVPYAARAREADTLAGKSATDFVLSEHLSDSVQDALKTQTATLAAGTEPGVLLVDNYLQKTTGGGASTTDSIAYDNGTNIGIGTASPGAKLDIGTGGVGDSLALNAWPILKWVANDISFGGYNASQWQALHFFANGTERLTVKSTGNVGTRCPVREGAWASGSQTVTWHNCGLRISGGLATSASRTTRITRGALQPGSRDMSRSSMTAGGVLNRREGAVR